MTKFPACELRARQAILLLLFRHHKFSQTQKSKNQKTPVIFGTIKMRLQIDYFEYLTASTDVEIWLGHFIGDSTLELPGGRRFNIGTKDGANALLQEISDMDMFSSKVKGV